jgi:hypothetical protein
MVPREEAKMTNFSSVVIPSTRPGVVDIAVMGGHPWIVVERWFAVA